MGTSQGAFEDFPYRKSISYFWPYVKLCIDTDNVYTVVRQNIEQNMTQSGRLNAPLMQSSCGPN